MTEAKASGKEVEVTSLRGESRDVYATPEGAVEAREYLRPIRARVGGQWKDIDTDLHKTGDGSVEAGSTTVDLRFSGGGDGPLVRMRKTGRSLALSWPTSLPTPTLDGDQATYHDVLPGVDLRMGAQPDGFTQLLVVKTAEAAASKELAQLHLKLTADGLDVKETGSGGLEAVDEGAQAPVFEAPTPLMWDSSPGQSTPASTAVKRQSVRTHSSEAEEPAPPGEPAAGETGKLAPVGVDVPADGGQVVLKPDAAVLTGKDTVYPVFIDPQWSSPRASSWTMVSSYWASSPQWKFNGAHDAGMGYCGWDYCAPQDTKRLFYQIPVAGFAGKSILSAEFVVHETWSASCEKRKVDLYQTKAISSSTTWNSQDSSSFWTKWLDSPSFAYGYNGCAAQDAEFNVKSAVQNAADNKWPTITFGLRSPDENDKYGWKRFSDKGYLRVRYNRPPPQVKPSQLASKYGGICKNSASAAHVRALDQLYANHITDPDGDNVAVQFQASWDAGDGKGNIPRWKPGLTTAKKSGSSFAVSLPSSIPANKKINWYVRVYDGAQYSPWSYAGSPEACYFVYDTSVPAAPAVSSGEYPELAPSDSDTTAYDGVGQYGTFTLKAADSDVTRYEYGIDDDPSAAHQVSTSGGAARDVKVLPGTVGLNFITVEAFDAAGNHSDIRTYQYEVAPGQPERATWQMDEEAGADKAKGSAPARTATLHGGATLGADGVVGTALSLNGTDAYAKTDVPVVDTSRGFSVSAWVKLDKVPDQAAVIATQPGNNKPGFELYYSAAYGRWAFNQYSADTPDASVVRVMADQPGGVVPGQWTHLVGAYDSVADVLQLYVDGTLVGQTPYSTAWNARRGLQLGAASYGGVPDAFFPGTLDEVQIFDKPVSANEVARLHNKEHLDGPGRPARAVFPLDEPTGSTKITGRADVEPAVLHGATAGQPGVAGNALSLDGTDDYASVTPAHYNSSRSYAVSVWAKLTKGDRNRTIVSQDGTVQSAFYLSYEAAPGVWSLRLADKDSADGTITNQRVASKQKVNLNTWTQLVAVHDTVAGTISLYVNGILQGTTAAPNTFYASGDTQIGRALYHGAYTDYFAGQIDDLRIFDRPVSEEEVHQLNQQHPVVTSRWKLDQSTTDAGVTTTPNDVAGGPELTLAQNATVTADGSFMGDGGLVLDGNHDSASTSTLPVDTSTSFTVSAWVRASALPTKAVSFLSAEGDNVSSFAVGFGPTLGSTDTGGAWAVAATDGDRLGANLTGAQNGQSFFDVTDWNHLTVVYDGFARQLRLYVNGELAEAACADLDGDGQADDPTCTEQVPWAENVVTWPALKSLQIGQAKEINGTFAENWPGAIDDVWTFQGALTDDQVARLASEVDDPPTEVPGTN